MPRPLGSYAVEWEPTEWRDDLLGRLGGALHATVIDFKPGREFFLADAYWLPPDGPPIGPMALEAICSVQRDGTLLARPPVRLGPLERALDALLRHHLHGLDAGARGAEEAARREMDDA